MSAMQPRPRPNSLGVGKSVIRRTRNAETAGAEPAAQTIHFMRIDPSIELPSFLDDMKIKVADAFRVPAYMLKTRAW